MKNCSSAHHVLQMLENMFVWFRPQKKSNHQEFKRFSVTAVALSDWKYNELTSWHLVDRRHHCISLITCPVLCVCVCVSSRTTCRWCSTLTWLTSTLCCPTVRRPSPLREPHLASLLTQVVSPVIQSDKHKQLYYFFSSCNCQHNQSHLCCRYVEDHSRCLLPRLTWRRGSDHTPPRMAVSKRTRTHTRTHTHSLDLQDVWHSVCVCRPGQTMYPIAGGFSPAALAMNASMSR